MKREKISEADSIRLWQANAEAWTELTRMGFDICRDHLNMPNFLSILPSVTGKSGLDIGCGEGANTRVIILKKVLTKNNGLSLRSLSN